MTSPPMESIVRSPHVIASALSPKNTPARAVLPTTRDSLELAELGILRSPSSYNGRLMADLSKFLRNRRKMVKQQNFVAFKDFVVLCLYILVTFADTQLVINVRNQGGDIVQENISANVTDDTVTLEFQRSDGTLVTQLIDFRNEVQILKSLILGEEERGQSQYQVMCFVFHFPKDSFISSDAMSKLRQKNPSAIRQPEEELPRVLHTMDYAVALEHSGIISPHLADACAEAGSATYTVHDDVVKWAAAQGIPVTSYKPALRKFPSSNGIQLLPSCTDMKNMWQPCQCHLELCIGWYPCGLKYCKGKGQSRNSVMNYRCGIKTCKMCHLFDYYVAQKQLCLWDE